MFQTLPILPPDSRLLPSKKSSFPGKLLGAALAVLGLFSCYQAEAQQQVVIGATTGTGSPYFGPTYNFGGTSTTDNSRHAYLYTAAELGIPTGANITEIAWLKADAGSVTGNNTFNLHLKNTTATTLTTATSWGTLTTGATQVYGSTSQAISGAANTYLAFPLTTPFAYTGGNLQIMTDWARAANPSDATTFYPNTATGMAIGTASSATLTNTSNLSTTTYGNSRPTIRISYAMPCTGTPLNGNYTINSATATGGTNFQSFTDAATVLNGCGVSGPVMFTVAAGSGPYTEQFALSNVIGVNAANTITFQGNGRTIKAIPTTTNLPIIKLDNADYIRINNLNIVVDTAATVGWGIQLINGSDHAIISNNTVTIPFKTGTNLNGIVAGTGPNVSGNNTNFSTIQNNTVIGGAYGISINGQPTNMAFRNRITGNIVQDADVIMVYLNNADSALVEGNNISRPTRTTTSNFQGIYMAGTNQRNVFNKNRIHTSGALNTAAYGINFRNGSAPAGAENLVMNNLIYNFQNTGATYGIVNVGNGGLNYFHNTIYFSKPNHTTSSVVQGVHQNELASNINFRNNIIVIDVPGTSTGGKHALFFNFPTSVITSNYNVLYVTPTTNNGHTGWYNATNYTTLANWQSANNGTFDQNSVSADPAFANPATGNLTPTNMALNNIGLPLAVVTTDINGTPRNGLTPDPGAYEFGPAPATPTIAASGATTFCQGGSVTLTASSATAGVTYQWYNNGTAISGATSATYMANASGNYTVEAILNGVSSAASAATAVTVNPIPAVPTLTAGGPTTFCQGDSVVLTASSATPGATYMWFHSSNLIPGVTSATYTVTMSGYYTVQAVSNGCYSGSSSAINNVIVNPKPATPTITKTGNMLTSSAVTGATYQWYSVSGTTLTPVPGATASTFTPTASGDYTVIVSQNGCESDAAATFSIVLGVGSLAPGLEVSVYPNPTAGNFEVKLTGFEKDATIEVINVTGQVISETQVAAGKTFQTFDLSGMANGVYILKVTSGDNLTFRKVMLD